MENRVKLFVALPILLLGLVGGVFWYLLQLEDVSSLTPIAERPGFKVNTRHSEEGKPKLLTLEEQEEARKQAEEEEKKAEWEKFAETTHGDFFTIAQVKMLIEKSLDSSNFATLDYEKYDATSDFMDASMPGMQLQFPKDWSVDKTSNNKRFLELPYRSKGFDFLDQAKPRIEFNRWRYSKSNDFLDLSKQKAFHSTKNFTVYRFIDMEGVNTKTKSVDYIIVFSKKYGNLDLNFEYPLKLYNGERGTYDFPFSEPEMIGYFDAIVKTLTLTQ